MAIHKHGSVVWTLAAALLCLLVPSGARADEIKLRSGEWYSRVGATPFQADGALDIVSYCGTSIAPGADDACVRAWVDAARRAGKHLYASAGDFTLSHPIPLFDGMHLRCSSPRAVVFRKQSGVWPSHFSFSAAPLSDVSIESCGFDMNADPAGFAFSIGGEEVSKTTYRGNRVFDGTGSRCRLGTCQRQYLVFKKASDILIENNHFTEGGRIKVGMPGRRIVIRGNFLEFVNDNGISVVSTPRVAWPDGTNITEDVLIDGNTIVDAIGAGIFYGADGETGGKGVITKRVTIINNTIAGDTSMCIVGTLPEQASEIFVGNNRCLQGPPLEGFNSAISLGRIREPTGSADRTTLWGNYVTSAAWRSLDGGGAFIVKTGESCLIRNVVRGVNLATRIYEPATVYLAGNDWGGGSGAADARVELKGSRLGCPCFIPSFLDVGSLGGARSGRMDPLAAMQRRCSGRSPELLPGRRGE